MYYFMDIFYAMGLNIIKKVCVKYGQTDDYEKKFCKFDEVVELMNKAIKEPDNQGNYHDYFELCKLYDKNENGTLMLAELDSFLSLLGKYSEVPNKPVYYSFPKVMSSVSTDFHVLNKLFFPPCILTYFLFTA